MSKIVKTNFSRQFLYFHISINQVCSINIPFLFLLFNVNEKTFLLIHRRFFLVFLFLFVNLIWNYRFEYL